MLIHHLILAFAEARDASDASAILGLIEKNGGLDGGNAAFRMADAVCSDNAHIVPIQMAALNHFKFFQSKDFCEHMVKLSMKRSPYALLESILENKDVQRVVEEDGYDYLFSAVKQTATVDKNIAAITCLLSNVEISARDKSDVLSQYASWASKQSDQEHGEMHAIVECLIKHGADPFMGYVNGQESAFHSFAFKLSNNASSYPLNGALVIEALSNSPQWGNILRCPMPGFVWSWYNSDGDMTALSKAIENKKLPNWWEGDPFEAFAVAMMGEKSGSSTLFSSLVSHIKKEGARETVDLKEAVRMIEVVLLEEDTSAPDGFAGIFRQDLPAAPDAAHFWSKRAPLIAGAFSDPKGWRMLCEKVAEFMSSGPQSPDQNEAFIEALRIEVKTGKIREIKPELPRRRL